MGDIQYFEFQEDDPLPFYHPHLAASEYVGKAKGIKQVLYERGLWRDGMLLEIDENDAKGCDQERARALCARRLSPRGSTLRLRSPSFRTVSVAAVSAFYIA